MIRWLKNLFKSEPACIHDWVMIDDLSIDCFGYRCSTECALTSVSRIRVYECSKCKQLRKTKVNYK